MLYKMSLLATLKWLFLSFLNLGAEDNIVPEAINLKRSIDQLDGECSSHSKRICLYSGRREMLIDQQTHSARYGPTNSNLHQIKDKQTESSGLKWLFLRVLNQGAEENTVPEPINLKRSVDHLDGECSSSSKRICMYRVRREILVDEQTHSARYGPTNSYVNQMGHQMGHQMGGKQTRPGGSAVSTKKSKLVNDVGFRQSVGRMCLASEQQTQGKENNVAYYHKDNEGNLLRPSSLKKYSWSNLHRVRMSSLSSTRRPHHDLSRSRYKSPKITPSMKRSNSMSLLPSHETVRQNVQRVQQYRHPSVAVHRTRTSSYEAISAEPLTELARKLPTRNDFKRKHIDLTDIKKSEMKTAACYDHEKMPEISAPKEVPTTSSYSLEQMFEKIALNELPELSPRMEEEITSALVPHPPDDTLSEAFSITITRAKMNMLSESKWLDDEIIDFYMNLLVERGKLEMFPSVYAFTTHFYNDNLLDGGLASRERWTKKIDVFSYDLIIIPVHKEAHWCLAAIDFRDKTIRYFDSMGKPNNKCLEALLTYLRAEYKAKKGTAYDTTGWRTVNMEDIPQQNNSSDCGIFVCMYAEFICRGAKINFDQSNMPYFRRKMVYEILTVKLLEYS